jgi:hypothetical protein
MFVGGGLRVWLCGVEPDSEGDCASRSNSPGLGKSDSRNGVLIEELKEDWDGEEL